MTGHPSFHARLIETLYIEARQLSDALQQAFAKTGNTSALRIDGHPGSDAVLARAGLQMTTRMMHATAWLLNHRAWLRGDIDAHDLARFGRLAPDRTSSSGAQNLPAPMHHPPEIERLEQQTRRFHARIARLDQAWHRDQAPRPDALERMRARIAGVHVGPSKLNPRGLQAG